MRNATTLAVYALAALVGLAWWASPAAAGALPVRIPGANMTAGWLRVAAEDKKREKNDKGEKNRGKNSRNGEKSEKLPRPVAAAVESIFPGGKIVGVEKEEEDGAVAFEVTLRFKSGMLETTLTPKGRVVKVKLKKEDDDMHEKKSKAKKGDDDDDKNEKKSKAKKGDDDDDKNEKKRKKSERK